MGDNIVILQELISHYYINERETSLLTFLKHI